MDMTFVLWTGLKVLVISLCIGVIVKFWLYGIRDLTLVLAPLVVPFLIIVFPIIALNQILFHGNKIEEFIREKEMEKGNKKVEEISLNLYTRIKIAVGFTWFIFRYFPLWVGISAQIFMKIANQSKIPGFGASFGFGEVMKSFWNQDKVSDRLSFKL